MAEQEFEEIISKARDGDDTAFERIVEMKKEKVFWIAYRIVGDAEEAKEVTQKAMIRLWKIIRKYKSEYKFDTWLFRIVTNLAIDQHRHLKRFKALSLEDEETGFRTMSDTPEDGESSMDMEKIFNSIGRRCDERRQAIIFKPQVRSGSSHT